MARYNYELGVKTEEEVRTNRSSSSPLATLCSCHAQAITGQVLKFHGQQELGKRWFSLKSLLGKLTQSLWHRYRQIFLHDFPAAGDCHKHAERVLPESTLAMKQKAAAWYCVAYSQENGVGPGGGRKRKRRKHLLSFAWIMCDVMCHIKKEAPVYTTE
jgi:hypothetical protein